MKPYQSVQCEMLLLNILHYFVHNFNDLYALVLQQMIALIAWYLLVEFITFTTTIAWLRRAVSSASSRMTADRQAVSALVITVLMIWEDSETAYATYLPRNYLKSWVISETAYFRKSSRLTMSTWTPRVFCLYRNIWTRICALSV